MKSDIIALQHENAQLMEGLIYYKGLNIDLRARMQDLEDDKHLLREKFEKLTALENKSRERFQLGPHFLEKLLKHLASKKLKMSIFLYFRKRHT